MQQRESEGCTCGLLIAFVTFLVTAAMWLFPNPFGAVAPRVFYSTSPYKLVQYELDFGSLYTPLPFCFRQVDKVYQGDEYFRTYHVWQYARETPTRSWTFYQREVRLKRVDVANVPQWQIVDFSEWKETEVMYYFGVTPKHELLLTTSEYSLLKNNCGQNVISLHDMVFAVKFDYFLYELLPWFIGWLFSALDLTPYWLVNLAIKVTVVVIPFISIDVLRLLYIRIRKTVDKNYTHYNYEWIAPILVMLAFYLLIFVGIAVFALDCWMWLSSQF